MEAKRFFISERDIENLIGKYGKVKIENHDFAGFITEQGQDDLGRDALLFNPIYLLLPEKKIGTKDDLVIQNKADSTGCPYPPGYNIQPVE